MVLPVAMLFVFKIFRSIFLLTIVQTTDQF